MAARASFVIPVLNEGEVIADTLRELRRRLPAVEIVVVDGGSSDATVQEALPLCDQLLIGAPGRAVQMNLGGSVALGDYLFFLHADTRPGLDAAGLEALLADRPAWGFCRVRLSGSGLRFRVIEWFMNRRSRLTRVATGDQLLFVSRELYGATGGFEAIPLMEDVAYCKRLRRAAPPTLVTQPATTSTRRWEARGTVRTVLLMWGLRLAYALGVPPRRLEPYYRGR